MTTILTTRVVDLVHVVIEMGYESVSSTLGREYSTSNPRTMYYVYTATPFGVLSDVHIQSESDMHPLIRSSVTRDATVYV